MRSKKPVYTSIDHRAMSILKAQQDNAAESVDAEQGVPPAEDNTPVFPEPDSISIRTILSYRPTLRLDFSAERKSFRDIWRTYGITVAGKRLQERSGFDQSNYTKARRGKMPVTDAHLIAACLLSKVTVQQAYDAFHVCETTGELLDCGTEATVLIYMLADMQANKADYGYDELIWWTLKINDKVGIVGIPEMHHRHPKWRDMRHKIDVGRITIGAVRNG